MQLETHTLHSCFVSSQSTAISLQISCQESLSTLGRCDVLEAPSTVSLRFPNSIRFGNAHAGSELLESLVFRTLLQRGTSNNQQHSSSNPYSHSSGRNLGPTSGTSAPKAPASSASFNDAALINSIKSSVDRLGNNREARFQQSERERIRITKENEELKRAKKDSDESLRVLTEKFEENERKIGILTQNERKYQNQLKESEDENDENAQLATLYKTKYAQLMILYNTKEDQSHTSDAELVNLSTRYERLQQKITELEEKMQEFYEMEEEIERNEVLIGELQKKIDSYEESLKSVETLRQQEKSRAEA